MKGGILAGLLAGLLLPAVVVPAAESVVVPPPAGQAPERIEIRVPDVKTTPEEAHGRYVATFARMPGFGGDRMSVLPLLTTHLALAGETYRLGKPDLIGLESPGGPLVYEAGGKTFTIVSLTNATLRARLARRAPDAFETNAVARLRRGEPLVLGPESTTADGVRRMAGPLHATTACVKCHACAPGTLLGALSYRLTPELRTAAKSGGARVEIATAARAAWTRADTRTAQHHDDQAPPDH